MKASASKTALLLKCQYWARDDVPWSKEKPSKASARGTEVHRVIAESVNSDVVPDFETHPWILKRALMGIRQTRIWGNVQSELGFSMNYETTIPLGITLYRSYPEESFCGTADVLFLDNGGHHIRDWKTGSPSDSEEWQLRALTAMATEAGHRVVDAKAVYLTEEGIRYGQDVLYGTDPKEDAATIRKHLVMVKDADPNPGSHCRDLWCPIRKEGCPARP